MKRVIVTGASGFVGANLARRLLREGHQTHLFISPAAEPWRIRDLQEHAPYYRVDLSDAAAVDRTVAAIRPEWVFHLAAYGAYSWQTDMGRMIATNITGTIHLLEACLRSGFDVMVNTGSSSEYGCKDHAPREDELVEPNSNYAVTKVSATLYCQHVARSRGVYVPTLRLYSVYGPWEEPNRLIPALIVNGLRGDLPPLAHPGTMRDYVYVDDVVDAYLQVARCRSGQPGAIYNVGTGVQTNLRDVVETARKEMGISLEPQWGSMSNRAWDTATWVCDSRKLCAACGWSPRFSFLDGFRATVDWFRRETIIEQWYRDSMKLTPS